MTSASGRLLPIVGSLRTVRPSVAPRRPDRRGDGRGADRARRTWATPASPGSRCRTACMPRPPARSCTPSSAPAGRSRWDRAPAWPPWRPALWSPPASPSEADVASFVAGLTLASGLLFLVLAVLRMGWIAQFLSRAVVTGFLFGAAIDVVIGELPKITGTDVSGSNSFQELRSWLGSLGDTSRATLVGRSRGAGGRVRATRGRAARPRRARPGGRGAARVVPVRPRRPRRRAGR